MFYTSAWCLKGEERFRENIPLIALGDSLLRFGSRERVKCLIVEGFGELSEKYKSELAERSIDVVDFTEEFKSIVARYPNIHREYSHYERNCLLRWIAFEEYRGKHDGGQFWHLDGDMALFVSLEELAEKTRGLTFMTLGCPCFLTVSKQEWFGTYKAELGKLEKDRDGYLGPSGTVKEECLRNDREKFNASLFRQPLGSDQDLLEYLISSGKLYQERVERILESGFYYIQNPMSFFQMDAYLKDYAVDNVHQDAEGHIIYRGLRIPFIHFQSGFYYFSAVTMRLGGIPFLGRLLLSPEPNNKETVKEISTLGKYLWKFLREIDSGRMNRNAVTNALSTNRNGKVGIVKTLNTIIDVIK